MIQVLPSAPRLSAEHVQQKLKLFLRRTGLFTERVHRIGTEQAFNLGVRGAEVQALGERVIRCNIGQPDYPLPEHIAHAL